MRHRTHQAGMRPLLLAALLLWAAACPANGPQTDLRVLIDVSGSMKHNDPANLRAPALRLLTGLLPEGSRAGVWNFGRQVSMEVPLGTVDRAWRQRAREAADRIHSRGLFTHIELALERSSGDWRRSGTPGSRHILLLTDGMVDVDRDPSLDQASRRRILDRILPRLAALGVRIHTIALSPQADRELLQTLAIRSGGWYEQIDSASDLQRAFLRLFEASVEPESLPVNDNRFRVDESVQDLTVLAFREPGAPGNGIVLPDGSRWTAGEHPREVGWVADDTFDMVTVKDPQPGKWMISGPRDPSNRALIVTNLRLHVDPLPAHVLAGDRIPVRAELRQEEAPLRDPRFLALTRIYTQQRREDRPPVLWPLRDDGLAPDETAGDGRFAAELVRTLEPGTYELTTVATSGSFQRQKRHALQVHASPFSAAARAEDGAIRIALDATLDLLDPEAIEVEILTDDGTRVPMPRLDPSHWALELLPEFAGSRVTLAIQARRMDGRPLGSRLELRLPAAGAAPAHADRPSAAEAPAPRASAPAAAAGPDPAAAPADGDQLPWLWIVVAAGNLLLAGVGGLGWRWWRRRVATEMATDAALLEGIAEEIGEDPGSPAGTAQPSDSGARADGDGEAEPEPQQPQEPQEASAAAETPGDDTRAGSTAEDTAATEAGGVAEGDPLTTPDPGGAGVDASDDTRASGAGPDEPSGDGGEGPEAAAAEPSPGAAGPASGDPEVAVKGGAPGETPDPASTEAPQEAPEAARMGGAA